ncbi:MAG: shikimate dehydrogenase [Prosthecobacter sp.]
MKRDVEGKIAPGFDRDGVRQQDCRVGDYLTFDELMDWDARRFTPPARLAVIGDPIAHSRSPQMHNPALRTCGIEAQYIRVQVPEGRVGEAFHQFIKCGFIGVNVTIPHKFEALAAVDEVDELASALGAVNTLVIRDGKLLGRNTDGPGFLRSVKEAFGAEVKDLRVMILGAGGGAGRAVAVQCGLERCRKLILVNRSPAKAETVAGEIRAVGRCDNVVVAPWNDSSVATAAADVDLIVNATSLGMKDGDAQLLPASALQQRHLVFDMVYRAGGETPLLADARAVGARVVDGLSLLLHQGAISFEHWFDRPAPLDAMRQGLQNAVSL